MLCLGLMSHTGTMTWAFLNKRAQSRLKPACAIVGKAWEVLLPAQEKGDCKTTAVFGVDDNIIQL
jgi:hypothetical protein